MKFSYAFTDQNELFVKETEVPKGVYENGHPEEPMDTDDAAGKPEKAVAAKQALRMSFSEYKRISNLLVLHMQKMEQCESWRHSQLSFLVYL